MSRSYPRERIRYRLSLLVDCERFAALHGGSPKPKAVKAALRQRVATELVSGPSVAGGAILDAKVA